MNRINEFLENLDKRNLILLYLSIFIIFLSGNIFLYKNFFAIKKMLLENKKISLIKKINELNSKKRDVVNLKKIYSNKIVAVNSAKRNLAFLKKLIGTISLFHITQSEYFKILNNYILYGSKINASFELNQTNGLNKFNIKIKGEFLPEDYNYFVEFLKILQQPKKIITIDKMNLNENKKDKTSKESIKYNLNLTIWSYK